MPTIKHKDSKSPKWIDGEIILLVKKKEKLRIKAKRSDLPLHWTIYREIRKHIKKLTKWKYRDYISHLHDSTKDNPKLCWSFYRAKTKAPGYRVQSIWPGESVKSIRKGPTL